MRQRFSIIQFVNRHKRALIIEEVLLAVQLLLEKLLQEFLVKKQKQKVILKA